MSGLAFRRQVKRSEIESAYWKYRAQDAEERLKKRQRRTRKSDTRATRVDSPYKQDVLPVQQEEGTASSEYFKQSAEQFHQSQYQQKQRERQRFEQQFLFDQQQKQQQYIVWLQQLFFQQQVFVAFLFQLFVQVRATMAPTLPSEGIMPSVVSASNGNSSSNPASSSSTSPSEQPAPLQVPKLYVPLPGPKTVGAPHFDGTNITDFLEEWEIFCQDHGLSQLMQVQRMPQYCSLFIGEYIKTLEEYIDRDWVKLCATLRKQYISQDANQKYYSRAFLEQYKMRAVDGKSGFRNYCMQFQSIAKKLMDRKELDSYTSCLWFMQGLPESKQSKVMRKAGLKSEDASTFDFEKVLKTALTLSEEEESLDLFKAKTEGTEDLKQLVDKRRQNPIVVAKEEVVKTQQNEKAKEPNTPKEQSKQKPSSDKEMDNLTEAFRKMTLPLTAKIDQMSAQVQKLSNLPQPQPTAILPRPQEGDHYSTQHQGNYGYGKPNNPPNYGGRAGGNWGLTAQEESDRNVCRFCGVWGHHRKVCPHLTKLIEEGKVHLNSRLQICWGPEGSGGQVMPLDRSMKQCDSVRMLLEEKDRRDKESTTVAGRTVTLYDSDSDEEEGDFLENFTYTVSSGAVEDLEYHADAGTQGTQGKPGRGRPPKTAILDRNAKVTKERAIKEKGIAAPKTLRTGEWRSHPIAGNPAPDTAGNPVPDAAGNTGPDNIENAGNDTDETMQDTLDMDLDPPPVRFRTGGKAQERAPAAVKEPKVKNEKLQNLFKQMAEENPVIVLEKMLKATIPDITVGDLLTSGIHTHKYMFKPAKPDVIKRVNVRSGGISVQNGKIRGSYELDNVLYSSASPRAAVDVNGCRVSSLVDSGAEVNLIEVETCRRIGIPYTADVRLKLVGIDRTETTLLGVCENVDISVGPVTVTQTLLVVEKASQPLVLGTPYASATQMMTQSHQDGRVEITISCLKTGKVVHFDGARPYGPKTRFLSHLYPDAEFADLKE